MDVAESERHNSTQIVWLNQRGGRTLSIVDLVEDGTLSAEMAALCWLLIERGASFITGAVPGGAGKTTLMGALLAFLPPGERLITIEGTAVMEDVLAGRQPPPATLLAHEVGPGRWFGYIWGQDAVGFFSAWRHGLRCVSCLHADTPEQAAAVLRSLGVTDADLGKVGLQLFMRMQAGPRRVLHRVSALHGVVGGRLRALYRWQSGPDRFEACMGRHEICALLAEQHGGSQGEVEDRWGACEQCLEGLQLDGVRASAEVRRAVLRFEEV